MLNPLINFDRGRLTCSQILRGKRKMKRNICNIYLN